MDAGRGKHLDVFEQGGPPRSAISLHDLAGNVNSWRRIAVAGRVQTARGLSTLQSELMSEQTGAPQISCEGALRRAMPIRAENGPSIWDVWALDPEGKPGVWHIP